MLMYSSPNTFSATVLDSSHLLFYAKKTEFFFSSLFFVSPFTLHLLLSTVTKDKGRREQGKEIQKITEYFAPCVNVALMHECKSKRAVPFIEKKKESSNESEQGRKIWWKCCNFAKLHQGEFHTKCA